MNYSSLNMLDNYVKNNFKTILEVHIIDIIQNYARDINYCNDRYNCNLCNHNHYIEIRLPTLQCEICCKSYCKYCFVSRKEKIKYFEGEKKTTVNDEPIDYNTRICLECYKNIDEYIWNW